ncbi:hypothetical protein OHC33_009800 [Knufia fluminis]|uniref:Transcription factor domain-containing protein n=1 Tax=Knufia fluminis TaxID=191047 RepID=A0AAN8E8V3_9EURO|nr:hypothetical protein OHC33_009800 [Knufia fluminis]
MPKCTDGAPCQACKAHGTDCIKDESEDMRRRLAMKKRLESAESDRNLLDSLLEVFKIANREQINSLINLVRSNAPRQDLQAFLDNKSPSPDSTDHFNSESVDGDAPRVHRKRRRTGAIADLMNPPIQVKASPWTTVTDDDDFVSHLMSLWFTWAHNWWHWVDRVLFLEAMQSQDLDNPLCAPYLVNMILADACLLDVIDEDEDEPHRSLRDQFYAEARKGIEAEEGRVSLTVLQASGVQWTYLDMNGQDKLGLLVLTEQIFMTKELDKYQERLRKDPSISPETLSKIDKAINSLEWALFALNTFTLVGSRRAHTIKSPERPHPKQDDHGHADYEAWIPYPRGTPQLEFHEGCHFACVTSLARVAHKSETLFMKTEENHKGGYPSFDMHRKLEEWANQTPSCMKLHDNSMPHVLALYNSFSAIYNWTVLIQAKQVAAAKGGEANKPTITTTWSSSSTDYWQQISVTASVTIGNLMGLLISRWGVENFPVILMHPVSSALLVLLEGVEHESQREAFVNMCVALRAASRRFRVGKGIMKLVKDKAVEMGVTLPRETEQLFHFERRGRSESTGNGQWEETPKGGIGMHYLLEKWQDLDLDEY